MPGFESSSGTWDWNADADQRAILQRLVSSGSNVIIEAFSNSPPYWMTKSGCASGSTDGSNNLKDDSYDAFADYLTEVVKHYRDIVGDHLPHARAAQRAERQLVDGQRRPGGLPLLAANQQTIIKAVGAALTAQGADRHDGQRLRREQHRRRLQQHGRLRRATLAAMSQMNVHTYSGAQRTQLRALATSKGKRLWQSESGPLNATLADDTDAAIFMAGRIIPDLRDLQPEAWVDWQVGDPSTQLGQLHPERCPADLQRRSSASTCTPASAATSARAPPSSTSTTPTWSRRWPPTAHAGDRGAQRRHGRQQGLHLRPDRAAVGRRESRGLPHLRERRSGLADRGARPGLELHRHRPGVFDHDLRDPARELTCAIAREFAAHVYCRADEPRQDPRDSPVGARDIALAMTKRGALALVALLVAGGLAQSTHAKRRSSRKEATPVSPADTSPAPAAAADAAVFLFVNGVGILRVQGGEVSLVHSTKSEIRDLQLDSEGALWASLSDVGVIRCSGGKAVNLGTESYARLAIRSPNDVWAINDSHGSVVHYDGSRWKTVRTRKNLTGYFDDNRLIDIASDGRSVWVASWNGLWRVTGARWTRVEPPPALAAGAQAEGGEPAPPAYPLSLVASRHGLVACYLAGCFSPTDSGWQALSWPVGKARLQSVASAGLGAGTGADGASIVVARLDGSGEAATSEPLSTSGINDVSVDESGRVWVAANDALVVLDARGRVLRRWQGGALEGVNGEVHRVVVAGAGPQQLPAAQAPPHPWRGQ